MIQNRRIERFSDCVGGIFDASHFIRFLRYQNIFQHEICQCLTKRFLKIGNNIDVEEGARKYFNIKFCQCLRKRFLIIGNTIDKEEDPRDTGSKDRTFLRLRGEGFFMHHISLDF